MEPKHTKEEEDKDAWTEFLHCKIDLSKKPLNPRPETEFWAEKVVSHINGLEATTPVKVLDIFSGSGCVGIAVANACKSTEVTLADKTNYISTPLPKNARFVLSDMFEKVESRFDFILANPPYIPEGQGVRGIMDEEPKEALYAGADGLELISRFLSEARDHLESYGQIWMEFGTDQKEAVTNILRNLNYYQHHNCTFHKDQYGTFRYLVVTS